ncbi:MAG: response regulator transcription factor [Acidimicrobiia bacterium]|nr:response regulator transcription factor [Acidimicrobiia bacterium]
MSRGLRGTLREAGFEAETPERLSDWARKCEQPAAVVTVSGGSDAERLRTMRREVPDFAIVVLVSQPSTSVVRDLLAAGACTVAGWDVSSEDLVALIRAALNNRSVLPTDQMRRLALGLGFGDSEIELTERELVWLRALGAGTTISQLAYRSGYSERAMYRLLAKLYGSIGVTNRVEALVWAAQRGIIG